MTITGCDDRLEGLGVKRQRRKRVAQSRIVARARRRPEQHRAMDFTRDTLADGRALRTLNLVDAFTRKCLAIEVDVGLRGMGCPGPRELRTTRGLPDRITLDNGPAFQSKALNAWAHRAGVTLQSSQPGKPVANTYIEAFNGRMRDQCLNQSWFVSVADTRRPILFDWT